MSRWLDRARRQPRDGQSGFTLIEIMVAIMLVGIAAAGSIPLLVIGMKAANNSKLQTQAKNLAQQRMESMRDLPFHVDRQNGPYVDLLDIYYTNTSTTTTTHTRAGETESGHWVSGGASSPNPSGAFYQVNVSQITGYTSFSQTIDTQFLNVAGNPISVSANSYDNLTAGSDQPLSSIAGVTVITSWTDHGTSHSYTSYTRISDSRGLSSDLTTQGSASFLQVTSGGETGNTLTAEIASADATGSLSTGSVAAAEVRPVEALDSSGQNYEINSATATSPGSAPTVQTDLTGSQAGTNECGWVGWGSTNWSGVTASTSTATTSGLPQVPSNVDTASPPTNQVVSKLTASSNNPYCGVFGFANQSSSYNSALRLTAGVPLVKINNPGGNSTVVSGSAWVNATTTNSVPHTASSGANTSSTETVRLFPGADFTGGKGVVKVSLSQSSISCLSSVAGGVATQTSSGSWTVNVSYWKASDTSGNGGWFDLPQYTWNSSTGSGSADPLAAIDPSSIVVYQSGATILHLSDYIGSWNTTRKITENANSGVHQLQGIVSITSQPTRAGDLLSAVGLQIGNLSCVADDNR